MYLYTFYIYFDNLMFTLWVLEKSLVNTFKIYHTFNIHTIYIHVHYLYVYIGMGFPGGLAGKNLPATQEPQETQIRCVGQEDPLEKVMATHFSILAWIIPWAEESDELQSMGLQRVRHDWSNLACMHVCIYRYVCTYKCKVTFQGSQTVTFS